MNVPHKRPAPSPGQRALERLLEIATRLSAGMEADTAGRGLTVARAEVVWLLHHRGPMRQRDLADALRVTPRNVTGLLDALERTGFVNRTPHPSDRRATLVQLSATGVSVASALASDQATFTEFLFADLDADQLTHLIALADTLLQRLRDPAYTAVRRDALDRWSAKRPAPDDGTEGR